MREEPKEGRGGRGTAPGDGAPVGVASVKYSVKGTPYYASTCSTLEDVSSRTSELVHFVVFFHSSPRSSRFGRCMFSALRREREHTSLMSVISHTLRIRIRYVYYYFTALPLIKEAR